MVLVVLANYFSIFALKFGVSNLKTLFWLSVAAFGLFFLFVTVVGTYEVFHNLEKIGIVANKPLGYGLSVATFLLMLTGMLNEGPVYFINLSGMVYVLFLVAPLAELWRHDERPFATAGYTMLPMLWVALPLGLISWMSADLTMAVFVLIWVNDTFAYLTGMLLGRHKMWVRHSPKKTWEGTIGGALFCVAAAIGTAFLQIDIVLPLGGWIVIGVVVAAMGTLGDLVESMFKRTCGVKDSGTIMPGHGGILDRFDSLLFAVPVVWLFVYVFLK